MTSLPSYDVIKLVHFQQKTSIIKSGLSPLRKRFNGMIVENWAKRWRTAQFRTPCEILACDSRSLEQLAINRWSCSQLFEMQGAGLIIVLLKI